MLFYLIQKWRNLARPRDSDMRCSIWLFVYCNCSTGVVSVFPRHVSREERSHYTCDWTFPNHSIEIHYCSPTLYYSNLNVKRVIFKNEQISDTLPLKKNTFSGPFIFSWRSQSYQRTFTISGERKLNFGSAREMSIYGKYWNTKEEKPKFRRAKIEFCVC